MTAFAPMTVLLVFAVTMFTSAGLLFLVQPMIAKLLLPRFGGTPSVWQTCMVFFQALLLIGYSYAHGLASWLRPRQQAGLHFVVLLAPVLALVFFPLGSSTGPIEPDANQPVLSVLVLLAILVGLPFFVVSTSAPLLQRWFGDTGHPSARDPYFLYAASNFGSMVSLLSYPFVVEPYLGLPFQGAIWMIGYGLLVPLVGVCGWMVFLAPNPAAGHDPGLAAERQEKPAPSEHIVEKPAGVSAPADEHITTEPSAPEDAGIREIQDRQRTWRKQDEPGSTVQEPKLTPPAPTLTERLHWIALAFIPSSLMLGVTTYMTTDISAVPLLWIPPLALYLLSFILVFSATTRGIHPAMVLVMPVMVLLLVFLNISETKLWIGWQFPLHLAAMFVIALVCHGELARRRPATEYLTDFYLCMSVGGVLGGMFNAFVAPVIFYSVAEYPLVLALSCLLLPPPEKDEKSKANLALDILLGGSIGLASLYVLWKYASDRSADLLSFEWIKQGLQALPGVKPGPLQIAVIIGVVLVLIGYIVIGPRKKMLDRALDVVLPAALALVTLRFLKYHPFPAESFQSIADRYDVEPERVVHIVTCTILVTVCLGLTLHPIRFGLGVAAMMLVSSWQADQSYVLHRERSFFGIYRVDVYRNAEGIPEYTLLRHGTTLHGQQRRDGDPDSLAAFLTPLGSCNPFDAVAEQALAREVMWQRRNEPLTYFHRTGPIGDIFRATMEIPKDRRPIAVLGLGTGTLASYAQPGQDITFYEIDPVAIEIAQNPAYFSYLSDCRGQLSLVLGDGRLKLQEAPNRKFRLLFMDAFTSDAIPVHLVTREAIAMYLDKLTEDGVIIMNVSNRYLRLAPVLANIAADLGLLAFRRYDWNLENITAKTASDYVVLARKPEHLGPIGLGRELLQREAQISSLLALVRAPLALPTVQAPWLDWERLDPDPNAPTWTDNFSNLLRILK